MRHPRWVRPDSHTRLGQLLPREQRPRVEFTLRRDITVANDPLRRQAVALQNVLEQRNQLVDLLLIPGVPLSTLGRIAVAGMDDLDADGAGVQPGAPLPAAIPGMPGAAVLVYQPVDGRRVHIDQVMTADLAQGQGVDGPGRV